MIHGSEAFFLERARAARRVAGISAVTALALLVPLLLPQLPPFRRHAEALQKELRFGVLGDEERWVRRIILQSIPGPDVALHDVGHVVEHSSRRGGDRRPVAPSGARGAPDFRPSLEGVGESYENRLARATGQRSDVPVVTQDQLVIDRLVRPIYPEEARERNLEGRVAVLALIDTTGAVTEVQIVRSSVHAMLEQSAVNAVWQCRFRPYKVAGVVKEVYVVIPFNFTIY